MPRIHSLLASTTLILALAACGDDSSPSYPLADTTGTDAGQVDADAGDGGSDASDAGRQDAGDPDAVEAGDPDTMETGDADAATADAGDADAATSDGGDADAGDADPGDADATDDAGADDTDAAAAEPCVRLSATSVALGSPTATEPSEVALTVTNCTTSGAPLDVENARFIGGAGGMGTSAFTLVDVPEFPLTLDPDASVSLLVRHEALTWADADTLLVETSAENVTVSLTGQGVPPGAPQLAGGCQRFPDAEPAERIAAQLPDAIACTAEGSDYAAYSWSFTSRPSGSTAVILGPERERAPLLIDVPGTYVVQLEGRNPRTGETSTASYTIEATAPTSTGLVVALFWDTPSSRDPFRDAGRFAGADLNLHLRATSEGCWNTDGDCHAGNRNPDWGDAGSQHDPLRVPVMPLNVGPEIIELDTPDASATYVVAARYESTPGADDLESVPYVLVYSAQELLAFEALNPLFTAGDWNVALELSRDFVSPWEVAVRDTVVELVDPPICR